MAKNVTAICSSLPIRTIYAIHKAFLISWEITAAKDTERSADDWNTFVSNPDKTMKPFKGIKWHTVQTKFSINKFK